MKVLDPGTSVRLKELLKVHNEYCQYRNRLLTACGREGSNVDPLAELAEQITAICLGGVRAKSPVQKGWDIELPEGEHVQVKYRAYTDKWENGHTILFPAELDHVELYVLVIIKNLCPRHLLVFRTGTRNKELKSLYTMLKKRHKDREKKLEFTGGNYNQIVCQPDKFNGVVDVFKLQAQ